MEEPHTFNPGLNRILNRNLKDLPLPPNLYYPPYLQLNVTRSTFICGGSSLGDDGGECDQEVILLTSFRLLRYLYIDQSVSKASSIRIGSNDSGFYVK